MSDFEIIIVDRELMSLFNALSSRATNTSQLTRTLALQMKESVIKNFEKEGQPKWKSLAKATIQLRKVRGFVPIKILQQTGRLLRSIKARYTDSAAIVESNLPYAANHQFGYPEKHIPKRPFLAFSREDYDGFKDTVYNFLKDSTTH